jgi:hypothetical protein
VIALPHKLPRPAQIQIPAPIEPYLSVNGKPRSVIWAILRIRRGARNGGRRKVVAVNGFEVFRLKACQLIKATDSYAPVRSPTLPGARRLTTGTISYPAEHPHEGEPVIESSVISHYVEDVWSVSQCALCLPRIARECAWPLLPM